MTPALVIAASLGYLLALFGVAAWADRRAAQGRSAIANAWVYAASMGVYCTAWTYYGSVGRAATGGVWFLPIYLGPTLAMVLAWPVLRKMIRISRAYRITSIADFIASRYGKSRLLAGSVTLIALVGVVPYVALQLKAVSSGFAVLTGHRESDLPVALITALVLAGFTIAFGTRHLDSAERHEGLVAAIAAESMVKLLAFLAVGAFVTWGLFDGLGDLFGRALAVPEIARVLQPDAAQPFAYAQWFSLLLLAMFSVILLPRQWQVMVVENVDEAHVRRAAWVFPAYLLLINLFVLPIALGGLLWFGPGGANPETFVLSLPLSAGAAAGSWGPALALLAFIGGLSAATGMVIVEAIAVSTMVCNDLVLPGLLHLPGLSGSPARQTRDLTATLRFIRRAVIVALLLLGWLYFRVAGEAYALVSIGLISFAAVAQFAPALLGGLYWKGGTRNGALAGLAAGALLWAWTLLLPSVAKSGWMDAAFLAQGPWGLALLRPEALLGLGGLDNLTHALFWSLLANAGLYVGVSLASPPRAAEAGQALLFVDIPMDVDAGASPERVFWRGRARVADLRALLGRFLGPQRAGALLDAHRAQAPIETQPGFDAGQADPKLVQFVETQLAGAIGSASARVMVAQAVEEDALDLDDVLRIVEEASGLRLMNEQLQSLDRLKDDFMSSVTHELRTPLTSIRALTELMRDDPGMDAAQRQQFLGLVVTESERLSRLVNQVLDLAKIESGSAEWLSADVDVAALMQQAALTTAELFRERGARLVLDLPAGPAPLPLLRADPDRLLQVLLNLLSNAAKFVPESGGRVALRLRLNGQGLTVEVQDNGPGIPLAQQSLVFEKFRQGGEASHRPPGTGLGLPISRRIVEHFGGRLWLRSEPGQGACFGFDLPLGERIGGTTNDEHSDKSSDSLNDQPATKETPP